MGLPLDLGAPAAEVAKLAAAVRDDQLTDSTPCAEYPVSGLLAHLLGLSVAFRDGAHKVAGPTTSTAPGGPMELPDDWRERLPVALDQLAEAWRDPAAWEGETQVGGVRMPAAVHAGFGNQELVLHGWDLATATGQPFDVAAPNLDAVWQLISSIPDDPAQRPPIFGRRVPIDDDAPLLDRAVASSGRRPEWSAGA